MERNATAGVGLWCNKKGSSNREACLLHQRHKVAEVAALPLRPRPAAAVQTPRATEIQNQGCSWTPNSTGFSSRAAVGMVSDKDAETVTSSVSGALSGDHDADVQYRRSPGNESPAHPSQLRNDRPLCKPGWSRNWTARTPGCLPPTAPCR
jgi:hypothetical protein